MTYGSILPLMTSSCLPLLALLYHPKVGHIFQYSVHYLDKLL